MKRLNPMAWLLVLMVVAMRTDLMACATCFGKSDSKLAEGMNWGIMSLLFIISSVLIGVACFFVYLAKRSAKIQMGSGPADPNLVVHH